MLDQLEKELLNKGVEYHRINVFSNKPEYISCGKYKIYQHDEETLVWDTPLRAYKYEDPKKLAEEISWDPSY